MLTKGSNWFYQCYVEGNTDFIWGYASVSLFESCTIHCVSAGSYIFQARSPLVSTGYVLYNCAIQTNAGQASYFGRSGGDPTVGDNVSIINCQLTGSGTINSWYDQTFGSPKPTPNLGTATLGWKQYGLTDSLGNPVTITPTNGSSYNLSVDEYNSLWSTRALILGAWAPVEP